MELERLLSVARLRLVAFALGVRSMQRRGDELAATLEKDHRLDPDKVLAALRRGSLAASGPDAFRAFGVFSDAGPDELCSRAARFLADLARGGALAELSGKIPSLLGEAA